MNPLIKKLPPWYHGDRLRGFLALEIPSSELSGHVLDEIIDEVLTDTKTLSGKVRLDLLPVWASQKVF